MTTRSSHSPLHDLRLVTSKPWSPFPLSPSHPHFLPTQLRCHRASVLFTPSHGPCTELACHRPAWGQFSHLFPMTLGLENVTGGLMASVEPSACAPGGLSYASHRPDCQPRPSSPSEAFFYASESLFRRQVPRLAHTFTPSCPVTWKRLPPLPTRETLSARAEGRPLKQPLCHVLQPPPASLKTTIKRLPSAPCLVWLSCQFHSR